jgi:hypothetical protein
MWLPGTEGDTTEASLLLRCSIVLATLLVTAAVSRLRLHHGSVTPSGVC